MHTCGRRCGPARQAQRATRYPPRSTYVALTARINVRERSLPPFCYTWALVLALLVPSHENPIFNGSIVSHCLLPTSLSPSCHTSRRPCLRLLDPSLMLVPPSHVPSRNALLIRICSPHSFTLRSAPSRQHGPANSATATRGSDSGAACISERKQARMPNRLISSLSPLSSGAASTMPCSSGAAT